MKGKVGKTRATVLSDLPESALHHILSYLSVKDSVRTSVLSKQWNSARKSNPFLDFKQPGNIYDIDFEQPEFKERLREFLNFVNRSLQHFDQNKLCIERMYLKVYGVDGDSIPLINTWLPLALHNGVSKVKFRAHVIVEGNLIMYPLPESTFKVNSSLLCGSFKFFRLESLTLRLVCLSENTVRDIIQNCPNIRHLSLKCIHGLETLNISKLDKLVSLIVSATSHGEIKRVYVDAISLKQFFSWYSGDVDLTSCCNLKEIKLCSNKITNAQFHRNITKFPLLEVLEIKTCLGLRKIKISLQRLKHLRVYHCKGVKTIKIDAPILSSFEFLANSKNVLISVSSKVIRCCMYLSFDFPHSSLSLKLREYLGDPFKGANFDPSTMSIKFSFDPDMSREVTSVFKVNVLDLTCLRLVGSFHWVTLLDTILSSCHPKIVSVIVDSTDEDNCVFRKMLVPSECQLCCNSSHCKCWRRHLNVAKLKSINGIELNIENVGKFDHKQFLRELNTFLSIPVDSEVEFRLYWDHSSIEEVNVV